MRKPKAILFDMDGLMVDSELTRAKSFKKIIRKHGGKVKEKVPQVIGVRVLDNWVLMKERYGLKEDTAQLMEEGEEEYTRLIEADMPIAMPGLFQLIEYLKKTKLKRAVVSSAGIKHIKIKLDKLKLTDFFEVIVSGDMLTKGKPDPEGYLLAAAKLGVVPEECLVLEDAPSGIRAAKAAKMSCIAIPSFYTKNDDFSGADFILKNLEEVISILKY